MLERFFAVNPIRAELLIEMLEEKILDCCASLLFCNV